MIVFECDKCGKRLKAADDMTGKKAACSKCGNRVVVPDEPGMELLEETENFNPPSPPPATIADTTPRMPPVIKTVAVESGKVSRFVRVAIWLLFVTDLVYMGGSYVDTLRRADTSIHQCFVGVDHCFWLIGAYTFARAIDSMTRK